MYVWNESELVKDFLFFLNPILYLTMLLIRMHSLVCKDVKSLLYAFTTSHTAVFQALINFADAVLMVFRCASVLII